MTDYKKLYDLMHLADQARVNDNYTLAEKFMKQLLAEAVKTKNIKLIEHTAQAIIEHRRLHIAHVLNILKRIDPIQAQRKVLS